MLLCNPGFYKLQHTQVLMMLQLMQHLSFKLHEQADFGARPACCSKIKYNYINHLLSSDNIAVFILV